jgi:SAM-dependent methyltransferase
VPNTDDLSIVGAYERAIEGHVFIRDTLDAFFAVVGARLGRHRPPPRVLELGSHVGVISKRLLALRPDAQIAVVDDDAALVDVARRRLSGENVRFQPDLRETPLGSCDLVVSVARHHHLPHDYLAGVRHVMKPGAAYVVADELCPEYCRGEHADRIASAELIRVTGGYVLTSKADVENYERTGLVPTYAVELERLRKRALWRWYRFVVDLAVERDFFDVAVSELRSTHDDLITESEAEHKFSPLIVERQFELAGFRRLSKRLVGPPDEPERQSMFVYEFGLA